MELYKFEGIKIFLILMHVFQGSNTKTQDTENKKLYDEMKLNDFQLMSVDTEKLLWRISRNIKMARPPWINSETIRERWQTATQVRGWRQSIASSVSSYSCHWPCSIGEVLCCWFIWLFHWEREKILAKILAFNSAKCYIINVYDIDILKLLLSIQLYLSKFTSN